MVGTYEGEKKVRTEERRGGGMNPMQFSIQNSHDLDQIFSVVKVVYLRYLRY